MVLLIALAIERISSSGHLSVSTETPSIYIVERECYYVLIQITQLSLTF